MISIENGTEATYTVKVGEEEIVLTLKGDDFTDVAAALTWIDNENLWSSRIGGQLVANYKLMRRVVSWQGVTMNDGSEAECNESNKLIFFGKYPETLLELTRKVQAAEEKEIKN